METIDINNLAAYQEDHRIEAKTAKNQIPNSIWETYSSFANTEGGVILLGVVENEDHSLSIKGVSDAHKLMSDFWNTINNRQKVSLNILTNNMVFSKKIDGKDVVVIEVPRAERTTRPIYIGQDPMKGTYYRFGDGDHLCSRDQISALYRDAASSTPDTKVLKGLDVTVFDKDTVNGYRNYFNSKHQGHIWSKYDNEMFLRSIGAMGFDRDDGRTYPTAAGLLMFGHEYDIVREFPDYFLDYREILDPNLRWTHRIVSSSGEWSGNLFDFFFNVYNRLRLSFDVPFVLNADGSREDNVQMDKALREMIVNTLAHADYYGQQGVVITRRQNSIQFANPGDMRTGLKTAISGGTSDARNSTIMKMFSLIGFGERAGSGIPDIFDICKSELGSLPKYSVMYAPNRTILDINAMIKTDDNTKTDDILTINTDDKTKTDDKLTIKADDNAKTDDKLTINTGDNTKTDDKLTINTDDNAKTDDKRTIKADDNAKTDDKRTIILNYIKKNGETTTSELAKLLGIGTTWTKVLLYKLVDEGLIIANGGNRNRTYKLSNKG